MDSVNLLRGAWRGSAGGRSIVRSRASTLGPRLRQEKIAEAVRRHGKVRVEQLAARFKTSHETIRRDLTALAETGRVQKFHGGAKRPREAEEGPFRERMTLNAVGKRMIAEKVARLIAPGETLMIDTGSTTLMCAEEISKIDGLTVIQFCTYRGSAGRAWQPHGCVPARRALRWRQPRDRRPDGDQ